MFLNISQNLQENTCVELIFNKVAGLKLELETPALVFSYDFYEIFKNTTLFNRTLLE